MTRINQDLSDTPSGLGYDPIPAGDYLAHITESDIANTKNGDLMLKLSWTVLEGPHASRILFDNVMLTGSEKAVAFGKRKLRTMADATGHPNPNHVDYSEELHGRPCLVKVGLSTYEGTERNEIKDYKSLAAPASRPAAPTPPPQSAPPASVAPPPPAPAQSTPPAPAQAPLAQSPAQVVQPQMAVASQAGDVNTPAPPTSATMVTPAAAPTAQVINQQSAPPTQAAPPPPQPQSPFDPPQAPVQ